jgi:hypothetical protein
MARVKTNPVPYLKNMEAYNDFSGGLNTVTSNDNLKDNEFASLVNVDLAERGSVKRRSGMSQLEGTYKITQWKDIGAKKWSEV